MQLRYIYRHQNGFFFRMCVYLLSNYHKVQCISSIRKKTNRAKIRGKITKGFDKTTQFFSRSHATNPQSFLKIEKMVVTILFSTEEHSLKFFRENCIRRLFQTFATLLFFFLSFYTVVCCQPPHLFRSPVYIKSIVEGSR